MSLQDFEKEASEPPSHPAAKVILHILRTPFLRNIFGVCLVLASIFPLYNWYILAPAYQRLFVAQCEKEAQRTAAFLIRQFQIDRQPLRTQNIPTALMKSLAELKSDLKLNKIKVYDASGKVIFSTDTAEIGAFEALPDFALQAGANKKEVLLTIGPESGTRITSAGADQMLEIFLPILFGDTLYGAFGFSYDVTAARGRLTALTDHSNLMLLFMAGVMVLVVVLILYRASNILLSHRRMDEALARGRDELEKEVTVRTRELTFSNDELQQEVGERRQAEAKLRESELRYRMLIDTIPQSIREIDRDGNITFVNAAHAKTYGYTEAELVGRSMFDLLARQEEGRQLREHLDYILQHQPQPSPWFSKDVTQDGDIIETQVDWNYKRDMAGQVVGLISVVSDITHRKKAEKALLDNIRFMNTLIDTIPNPVFFKDDQGSFLGCNVAYAQTLGLPKEEILGRRLIDLQNISFSDMAEHFHRQDLMLIATPGIQIHEEQFLCADGQMRDFMLFKATFREAEGQVAGLVGIMLDISARKQMEKELKESKDLFDAFMYHLPGLAFMKDLQGHYLFVNRAFTQFTGSEDPARNGVRDDQVWDPASVQVIHANDRQVRQSLSAVNAMETVRLPNQQERNLLTTRFPVFADQRLSALGGISIDVTERTANEHKRQQLERQLQQAQKMEALGTLAGGVAHDFNNILASIIGYSQIALADVPGETPLHGYLQRVLQAGERASDLVKQILTFSRKSEVEPTPVRVKIIVKEVLKLVRATLPVTISIVQEIKSDAMIMADPVQVHQVMMNLCANAGYAMRAKGGRLTVSLTDVVLEKAFAEQHADVKLGPYLKLSVADNGVGIPEEHLHRIFEPFFTTKPKGEGTGMGLSVVHGIVSNLGGVIDVQSTPGQGARFDIYLPVVAQGQLPLLPQEQALPVGKESILFVDDEVFQTDMLKHMLGLLGYKVQTRNRGADALALFEQDPRAFDLVITDMVMPEMTGDELSRQLLQIRPDLPIILCTGYSENISESQAKELGIRAFALKPLSMEALSRLIRKVLDQNAVEGPETE